MSAEQNKATVRRAFEELNGGRVLEAEEYFAPNFIYHDAANPQVNTREQYMQFLTGFLEAFPGHFTLEDVIAEGDKVVARYTFHRTHRGHWRGVAPTGKPITFTATSTYRFADGKVAEMWQSADTHSLLQQLGVIPAPDK